MNGMKLFKKFLMPCGLCSAIPVMKPQSKEEPVSVNNEIQPKNLIRPSELPIYTFEQTDVDETTSREPPCTRVEEGVLEQNIGNVRKTAQEYLKQITKYTDMVTHAIDTGFAHSQGTLDYLREESNVLPRVGAVGVGGITGLILGLRGGKFKKLFYTSTGALTVAGICYPKEAQEGLTLMKYYANVGYNFFYGVKPGDSNQLEISWPEMSKVPTNLNEFKDAAGGAAGTAVSAVCMLVSKGLNALKELTDDPVSPYEKSDKTK